MVDAGTRAVGAATPLAPPYEAGRRSELLV
jgi:hypothetical protein